MKTHIKIQAIAIILLMALSLASCNDDANLDPNIARKRAELAELRTQCSQANSEVSAKQKEVNDLNEKLRILHIYESGNTPKYVLKLRLKQSHVSLDVGKHMKDAMNSIEFELPVDHEFYNSVDEGDRIVDRFRAGSFIMKGSFGDWRMTVIDKYIR